MKYDGMHATTGRFVQKRRRVLALLAWGAAKHGAVGAQLALGSAAVASAADRTDDLKRLFAVSEREIRIPSGIYHFRNPLELRLFDRSVVFEPGARLIGLRENESGLVLDGCRNVSISGLNLAWLRASPRRTGFDAGVLVRKSVGVSVHGCVVRGGPCAGVLFTRCEIPVVEDVFVSDTKADGVHFANCLNPIARRIETENTGDDGLAFVNYAKFEAHHGGYAEDILVSNSLARGIAVVGQQNVTVDRFEIRSTAVSGIYIAHEYSYDTRRPSNVTFSNGVVELGGQINVRRGNKYGAEIVRAADVSLVNIRVLRSRGPAVSANQTNGVLRLESIVARENSTGAGFNLIDADRLEVIDCVVDSPTSLGMYVQSSRWVEVEGLTFSGRRPSRRDNRLAIISDVGAVHLAGVMDESLEGDETVIEIRDAASGIVRRSQATSSTLARGGNSGGLRFKLVNSPGVEMQ